MTQVEGESSMSKPSLFIGSSTEGLRTARALRTHLKDVAEARVWTDGVFGLGRGILETLVEIAQSFDFAVLVLTPEDLTSKRNRKEGSPRDNVLFELGLFMGTLGRQRTFVVRPPTEVKMNLPSDLGGIVVAELRAHSVPRTATAQVARLIRQAIMEAPPRLDTESALNVNERKVREASVESNRRATIARSILARDLEEAMTVLEREIVGPGRWTISRETQWWQTWLTYRADLVIPLGDESYRTLSVAFEYVHRLQDGLRALARDFNETDEDFLTEARDALHKGLEVLGAH
jgi:hypothetical protein